MPRTRPTATLFVAVASVATLVLPTMAQTSPTTAPAAADNVPVKHVSLFSSGVGYFQHAGTVSGNGATTLHFKAEQVNDVLKSLVLQDLDGGSVSSVNYPSLDPLGHALKGFQVDLSESPAIGQLLGQLRGAEVAVTTSGNRLVGKILGVEVRKKPVGETTIESATLNLVTNVGIQSIAIDDATSIQLTDARLQDELNKALAAVASARDSDKKTVTVNFAGTGERRVSLGYVIATPLWKTSYRLVIGDKADEKSNLQGWAIVENQTDSDWNDISLSLVSGRPLSFRMDLYEPMYVERPEVELELFAGLAPPKYAESREELARVSDMPAPAAAAAPQRMMKAGQRSNLFGGAGGADDARFDPLALNVTSSVASQATAGQIGELFQYQLSNITLARQSSAMVPIVTDAIEVDPISIYNPNVLARYPLTGARVKNTTGKNLLQGPITVFQGGSYAGDAQVNNVPPGQTRLISYGIDLQVLVDAEKTDQTQTMQTAKITNGTLEVSNKTVSSRHYKVQNKSPDKAKTVVIEHAKLDGWELVDTDKPAETTDTLYRFERKLDATKEEEVVVRQQRINWQRFALIDVDLGQLVWYAGNDKTPDKVKEALRKAIELRQQQADLERQIAEHQQKLGEITAEQNRIRENLKTIRQESALYGRLMTKLEEQETTIDKTQESVTSLTEQRNAKRSELETYVKGLKVE